MGPLLHSPSGLGVCLDLTCRAWGLGFGASGLTIWGWDLGWDLETK